MTIETAVLERYSAGAEYDRTLLKLLPPEIIEKDYGCGDLPLLLAITAQA